METQRIDKYLWTIRQYKTRTQASDACRGGKVKLNGIAVKPSRDIKIGDILELSHPGINKRIKILDIAPSRMGAQKVPLFMEDLTPPEELEQWKQIRQTNYEYRDRGVGRPTKKDRRDIEELKKYLR
ncbi:heat-shock protein Hsp15 [Bacteroidia bacterium]|nr:heat-shock protein Hsp15 [Bacteroidia bacterium]